MCTTLITRIMGALGACNKEIFYWYVYAYVVQAQDKARWQKLFSQFCSRTANEEEEIAHKLLGEKFKVGYHHVNPTNLWKLDNVWSHKIMLHVFKSLSQLLSEQSTTEGIEPMSVECNTAYNIRSHVVQKLSSLCEINCNICLCRGSWLCCTAFLQQHFTMIISVGWVKLKVVIL